MSSLDLRRTAVLIPARRMEPGLAPLVQSLLLAGVGAIVLVDDGISAEDQRLFAALCCDDRVHLLHHAVNLGKGRALKTGINYVLTALSGIAVLVTADADGQHAVEDILRVAEAVESRAGSVALGSRVFSADVPARSRLGNVVTSFLFQFVSGRRLKDTQTGLRGFPIALLRELLVLPGERYEYEMTVLAEISRRGTPITEVPIATIYIDNNRSSYFNPVRDSMRIYFVLLRFYASSLISACLDLLVFSVTYLGTGDVLTSIITGRLSSLVNFALNRGPVFHSRLSVPGTLWRYYLLVIAVAAVSYGAIIGLKNYLGWNVFAAKIVVDTFLSLATFSIQRIFVFPEPASELGA